MEIGNIDPAIFYSLDGASLGQVLMDWNLDGTIISNLLSINMLLFMSLIDLSNSLFIKDQGIDGGTFS